MFWYWVLGGVVVLLAAGGYLSLQAKRLIFQPITFKEPHMLIVRRHATLGKLAPELEKKGYIPSAYALRVYARLTRKDGRLKAGEYEISGKMNPAQILDLLNSGHVKAFWVTIPEGKWATEISRYFATHWPDSVNDFPTLVNDAAPWQAKYPFLQGKSLEGYLFPNTYLMSKGASAEQLINTMLRAFRDRCWAAYQANPPKDGRSFYQVLILASMIEAEAKVPSERPIIAGVYLNRLKKGMLLQCDATVLYAHHQRMTRVLYKDLEIDSPYNTYKYPGLPVGPICNPGESSFKAALHPAAGPYLYYVAKTDGSGQHIFSTTMAEHQNAIQQLRNARPR
jgi:UPF0755 protein